MILPRFATTGLLFLALLLPAAAPCHGQTSAQKDCSISIIACKELLTNPISGTAIHDSLRLLRKGFPRSRISLNDSAADIRIILPRPGGRAYAAGNVAGEWYEAQ